MPIADNRPGSISSGGGVTTINGMSGPVVLTAASVGAEPAKASQGSPATPLLLTNLTVVPLNTTADEVLYVAGNGGAFNINLANFTGIKAAGKKLEIVVSGAFALTFQQGGNFTMNGNRRTVTDSILTFISNGTKYIEDGGNEIA